MEISPNINQNQPKDNLPTIWQEDPGEVCSFHTCANGHKWPIQTATTHCKGCHHPIIALRMTNCQVCNEPAKTTNLRIDYIGGSHPLTSVCKNEFHVGPEYITTVIEHCNNKELVETGKTTAPQQNTANSLIRQNRGEIAKS